MVIYGVSRRAELPRRANTAATVQSETLPEPPVLRKTDKNVTRYKSSKTATVRRCRNNDEEILYKVYRPDTAIIVYRTFVIIHRRTGPNRPWVL